MPVVLRAFFIRNIDAKDFRNEKPKQNHLPGCCPYDHFDTRNIHSDYVIGKKVNQCSGISKKSIAIFKINKILMTF